MPTNSTPFENLADESSTIGAKISDSAEQVKDKVADLGRTAANRLERNREAAAGGLQQAASAIHQKADSLPGGEKVTDFAHAAADKLSSTADYVRDHDFKLMLSDVESVVKKHPGRSLLAAVIVGFLIGRAVNGND